ncbi:MAG: hypothetical protein OXG60_06315 [Chloroflexi bacterium]|nr:hypothetical protein [Chloroflexota bacterium]
MPNPVFVFGFVLATLYGLGFHVAMGGSARRMVLFVTTSWVGFLLGQYIGNFIRIDLFRIGIVHLLPATVSAFVFLIFAHLITAETQGRVTRR